MKFNKKSQVKIEDDSPESGPWVQGGGNDSDCRGIDAVATDHMTSREANKTRLSFGWQEMSIPHGSCK